MDTIIYLYIKKESNTRATQMAPVFTIRQQKESYKMIFAEIPEVMLYVEEKVEPVHTRASSVNSNPISSVARKFWRRKRKKVNQQTKQEPQLNPQPQVQKPKYSLSWVRELYSYLIPYITESAACYCFYDDSMEKWIKKQSLNEWWEQHWPIKPFQEFHQPILIETLLANSHLNHYIVLGYDNSIPEILFRHVRQMKSLRLILAYENPDIEACLDDIYEDYGLATSLQIVKPEQTSDRGIFRTIRIACEVPSVILDFTGESHILTADIARDSIWLDFDSNEEKRRRIEDRNTGILYDSTRKQWKQLLHKQLR